MSSHLLHPFRRYTVLLACFIAGCSSLPPAGTLESNAASREVTALFWDRHVIVPAQVTEPGVAFLLLDSGANMTVLDLSAARRLGITVGGTTQISGYGEEVLEGGVAELAIGVPGSVSYRLYRPVADFAGLDAAFGRRFEGVLGADFFGRFVIEIDYADERVILHDPRRYRPHPEDVRVALEIDGGRPHARGRVLLPDGREIPGRFIIDTGDRSGVTLNSPFVRTHAVLEAMPATTGIRSAGTGGWSEDREGRLRGLRLGNFTLDAPLATLSLAEAGLATSDDVAGHVGGEVLRRFTVTFDYRNRALYLRPNARYHEPFEADMAGFGIVAEGADLRQYRVSWIDEGSPAERAGLRSGDLVVEVDGRITNELIMPDWHSLRRAQPGQLLRLAVERGNERLVLAISLERRL
jgi:hypothetical protein